VGKRSKFTISLGLYGDLADRVQSLIEKEKRRFCKTQYAPKVTRHSVITFLLKKGLKTVEAEGGEDSKLVSGDTSKNLD